MCLEIATIGRTACVGRIQNCASSLGLLSSLRKLDGVLTPRDGAPVDVIRISERRHRKPATTTRRALYMARVGSLLSTQLDIAQQPPQSRNPTPGCNERGNDLSDHRTGSGEPRKSRTLRHEG